MMKKAILTLAAVALMAMMVLTILSCDHQQQTAQKQTEADSIIMAAYDGRDYECAIALCDSLEQAGDISKIRAALFRGNAYFQLGKMKPAEDEYKKAMVETPKNETDSLCFYQIACKLSEIYNVSRNDDGVLQLALPKIEELNVWAEKKPSEQIFKYLQILTINVGQTQLRLGMKKEAEKM